jgi:hypothetical protein
MKSSFSHQNFVRSLFIIALRHNTFIDSAIRSLPLNESVSLFGGIREQSIYNFHSDKKFVI